MEKVFMNGPMEGSSTETGKIIKWTDKENLLGMMEENMLGTIKMIKNMVMDNLSGLMEENIKDIGKMENNTEEVFILEVINRKEKENGMKERELDGFKKMKMGLSELSRDKYIKTNEFYIF